MKSENEEAGWVDQFTPLKLERRVSLLLGCFFHTDRRRIINCGVNVDGAAYVLG